MPLSVSKLRPQQPDSPSPKKRGRFRRFLLWFIAVFLVLLIIGYFVGTSDAFIRRVVLPKVSDALNADLSVADIGLNPFSLIGLRDLKVTPRGADPLLTAGMVRVRYSLFAFLRGNIDVAEITIDSPTVDVIEKADGSSNLDPLLKKPAATKAEKPSKPPVVNIQHIELRNATVRQTKEFKDGGRRSVELANINLSIANIKNAGGGKMDLAAALAVKNSAAGQTDTLQAKIAGNFSFNLTADLKPGVVNGKTTLTVDKAEGRFADFAALTAVLDAEATPTEVKQMALRFSQGGATLGELRASGPFDANKTEGRLEVVLSSLDRRVLNIFGAASGIDFGTTTVSSTNIVEFANGGATINASGTLNAAHVAIKRENQTTPTLDFRCDYSVAVTNAAQSALLQNLNLTCLQNGKPVLTSELTSPMTVAWGTKGGASGGPLRLTVTNLNLAEWRAFAADAAPEGVANATVKLLPQEGGDQLAFDIDGGVSGLSAKFGDKSISHADVHWVAKGNGRELKVFKFDEYRFDLAREGKPAVTLSGSGTFDRATGNADLQTALQVAFAPLLELLPQPGAEFTGGTLDLKGHVTSQGQNQTVAGQLVLADLKGRYGDFRFTNYGSSVDLDVAMKAKQLEIHKATGSLREGTQPGGTFDATGSLDLEHNAGKVVLKFGEVNENGLRPFLQTALGDNQLVSASLNSTATVGFEANGDATVKADLKLANLVVKDPKGSLPTTPLEARALLDAAVAKQIATLRQCQFSLTPTARAKNELNLTGTVNFSNTNAITGNLKLASDALDLTRYFDLFYEQPKPGVTKATPPTAPPAANANVEPAAVHLPFANFTFAAALGRFYLREVDAANIQATAKLDASRLLLDPCQLKLNGAPVSAKADLDLSVPGYKYDLTFNADRVPVEPLANSFSSTYSGQAKGTLIASAQIKGAGITGRSLQKSLAGGASFSFTNAEIQVVGGWKKWLVTPIVFVLGEQELLRSPLDYVNADLRLANGNIQILGFTAHSAAFRADSQGTIPIADVLMNSPLTQDVDISLARNIANKLRFSNVPENQAYLKLPTFVHLRGTLGNIETKTDKAVIAGLTVVGAAGAIGGKAGVLGQAVGGVLGLGGQNSAPPAATNAPATNAPQTNRPQLPFNPFDLLKPKK